MNRHLHVNKSVVVVLLLALLLLGASAAQSPAQAQPAFDCAAVTEIPTAECEALTTLYNSTNGANWTDNSGWLATATPCSWFGVNCTGEHVTNINLHSNHLNGSIPPELGSLTHLYGLFLSNNQLAGSLPPELGNLAGLRHLVLYFNQLSGGIPGELGNLVNLAELNLYNNRLDGSIPPELGNLTGVSELDLGYNRLSGTIAPELGNLTGLAYLALDGNQLSGTIPPELGDAANLMLLYLGYNQLSGNIPPEIGNLTRLVSLSVSSNQLSGTLPSEIGNLVRLETLRLDRNHLSGDFPASIMNLVNLNWLTFDCTLTSSDPDVIAFLLDKAPGIWQQCTSTGSISGTILAADGMTVITNTLISVHAHGISPGSSSLGTHVPQADGSYTISGLAPGTHKVQANNNRDPSYVTKYYDDKLSWDSADTIEVVAGQVTPGINFALEPGGAIRGAVLDEDGNVITDVQLHVGAGTENGIWASAPVSQIDGSYELVSLPDGEYRVEANFFTLGYDRKYYDNVYRWDLATLVPIVGGNTVTGINFALGPGGGISGHVYAQDGITPVEGVCVNVSSTAPEFNQVAGWGRTGPDGSFSFGSVPVGEVYIRTHASCGGGPTGYVDEWYAEGGSVVNGEDASAVTIVVGQLTPNSDFNLDPAGSISGAIYNADGSSLLHNVMYGFESADQQGSYTTWCTADGLFAADLAFGSYKVFAQGNSEHCRGDPNYKREYWQEKTTWAAADIITLTAESPHVGGIVFTLEPGGMIAGSVFQADGVTPIPHAWVYAMDTLFQFVTGSHAQADGSYVIGGLDQGSYYLAVQAEGFGGVYYPNGHDDPGAVLVQVSPPGTTPNINFTLSPEATLSGYVLENDGSTPIAQASIAVWPRQGGQIRSALSDENGAYTVHGLSTGTYVAKAEANGFETEFYLDAFDWPSATPIAVTQPEDTPGITFTLSQPSPLPPAEKQALEALHNSTNGSQWFQQGGWLADPDGCTWYGVTCHDGHVAAVRLAANHLSGSIPTELASLASLRYLDLSSNQLDGAVPLELGDLTSLRNLNLHYNQLSGMIPPELGNLTNLQWLGLHNNQLDGTIPPALGNLADLEWLALSTNHLSGTIPSGLGVLANLRNLYLFNNQLSGTVPPELGNLAAMRVLFLHNNPLAGDVPNSLIALSLDSFTFYGTDLCAPATSGMTSWLNGVPNLYGTGLICGQLPGSLTGSVTLTDTTPIAGAQVNLYRSIQWGQWQPISTTQTNAAGSYEFGDLGQGPGIDYRVQFVDPSQQLAPQYYDNMPTINAATAITITPGVLRSGIDAILALPQPPAVGVDAGSGSVVFNADGTAQINIPAPNLSDIIITRAVSCALGAPEEVTLRLSTGPEYPMIGLGGDLYEATIPTADLTGNATISVVVTCNGSTTTTTVGYITLYDPSGFITDARTGQPIAGASVTLYHVPGWQPKTGPEDNPNTCESNLSRPPGAPWSQPAPTDLGMIANADVTPIAPRLPFQLTTTDGYYGWDVSLGCWYVTVEASGYQSLVSPVVGVPPEVTDLNLTLTPAICPDFDGSGLVDVHDIMQAAARWNNPAAYDPTYDIAPPFGSPIDIQDIIAIAEQWDSVCQ